MILYALVFNLIILGVWSQDIERLVVPQGHPFTFDCQLDESVYFGRRLDQWTEIVENNEDYVYLNLNFNYLNEKKILRVTSDSAESKHTGFYGCRKASWTSTLMNSIYQLILADVSSFYWNYICYGPVGSCQRSDDSIDENFSRFEVADQTNVELFCCATVTGYKGVSIQMNPIGDYRRDVEINKKEESDGSWVICANQQTIFKRTSYSQSQTLTCELSVDNRHHSTLSSLIIIKGAMVSEPSNEYPVYSDNNRDNEYFRRQAAMGSRSRKRLTTGKKIGIIIGSIVAGILLIALITCLIIYTRRNKKTSSSLTPKISRPYVAVRTYEKTRYENQDAEPVYEEPTPLSTNAPVFMRC